MGHDRIQTHNSLKKTFQFKSFIDSITWMQDCSIDIVSLDHHSKRTNVYDQVHVILTTHDVHTVTSKDFVLAEIMDKYYDRYHIYRLCK